MAADPADIEHPHGHTDQLELEVHTEWHPPASGQLLESLHISEEPQEAKHTTPNVHGPFIQPIKASFQFDTAEGFGDWQLWLLSRAQKDLRAARKRNPKLFDITLCKMKDLSHGHFSGDNMKRLVSGSNSEVPVFEAKMTGDTRLVYMVDCIKDFETELEKQVLRVFGIYTHAQFDGRLWSAVSKFLSGKGLEYRRRCLFRKAPLQAGSTLVPPETFSPSTTSVSSTIVPLPAQDFELEGEDREALHELLVLDKFVAFTKVVMEGILADQDAAHVFDMSPLEQEIVKYNDSCIVMGRSGTGKTTTIVFKMFGIEHAWQTSRDGLAEGMEKPRQLFVTQSQMLATNIKAYYQKLCVPYSAEMRRDTSDEASPVPTDTTADLLVDRDEEAVFNDTLPDRYSELKDEHFPLFLSFDHLCRLIGADVLDADTAYFDMSEHRPSGAEPPSWSALQRQSISQFVSYDRFVTSYWPRLPQKLTKNLDPLTIYSEFMGVIKGSERALANESGFLDETQYVKQSQRQGVFSSGREIVYTLFQAYDKLRRTRREWDAADRTHSLLRALERNGPPGKKLDFIYVDEMQDNLLIDALVLKTLVKSVNGLFWAGDTAQTISAGSSFRFDELKAFLHRRSPTTPSPHCFQLSLNYRSHSGILRCANSVVKLNSSFWPNTIDRLDDERGIVDGSKPLFFSGKVKSEDYLSVSGEQMEFGAKQCILVRDEKTRAELRALVGDIGLILTLHESKGLEFDDVLLYKFLEDSPVSASQWRVVLNALPSEHRGNVGCPTFDAMRHGGLCHELKCLYVGLTRARKSVWIVDSSPRAQPLRALWRAQDLVQDCSSLDVLPRFARSSDPDEWADTAKKLFERGHYLQAMRCYERAGMDRERDVAQAYSLRRQAQMHAASEPSTRTQAFVTAAETFVHCADVSSKTSESQVYHRIAGQCFLEGGDDERAASCFLLAEEYGQCALCYRSSGALDRAVQVVREHRSKVGANVVETVFSLARLHYLKESRVPDLLTVFDDTDDALRYAETWCTRETRASLLEIADRYSDAAEVMMQANRPVLAVRLARRFVSTQCAERYLLSGLWHILSFGIKLVPGSRMPPVLSDLLCLAREIYGDLSPCGQDQVTMFEMIAGLRPAHGARNLGESFLTAHKDRSSTIHCLDFFFYELFKKRLGKDKRTSEETHSILIAFSALIRQLATCALHVGAEHRDASVQRAFKLRYNSDGTVTIYRSTFLYSIAKYHLQDYPPVRDREDEADNTLSLEYVDFKRLFREAIYSRVTHLSTGEQQFLRRSGFVCPFYLTPSDEDLQPTSMGPRAKETEIPNSESNPLHVKLLFGQILMYDALRNITESLVPFSTRRTLLFKLYQLLWPNQGYCQRVVSSIFVDLAIASRVAVAWIRGIVQKMPFLPRAEDFDFHLSDIAKLMSLAFMLDPIAARRCIETSPCLTLPRGELPKLNPRQPYQRYILESVQELVCLLEGSSPDSVASGMAFLHLIAAKELPLDVNVLCHVFESLAVRFVLAYCLDTRKTLHDTVIPQNWIAKIGPSSRRHNLREDLQLLPILVSAVSSFLDGLWLRTQQHLKFEHDVYIDNDDRAAFTLRLCKCILLVAYNIPNRELRSAVKSVVMSLPQAAVSQPTLSGFLAANEWDELMNALWVSQTSRPKDELILLKDFEKSYRQYELHPEACVVVLDEARENISGLIYDLEFQDALSKLSLERNPLWDRRFGKDNNVAVPVTQFISMPQVPILKKSGFIYNLAQAVQHFHAINLPSYKLAVPSPRENAAATTIARFYRRQVRTRANVPKGIDFARARWFSLCRARAFAVTPTFELKYRVLFLGPLPHALVCLEGIVKYARDAVKCLRDRLATVQLADYETLAADMDKATSFHTRADRLQKKLDPASAFHERQDVDALRSLVEAMACLAHELSIQGRKPLRRDLDLAVKGISRRGTKG